MRTLIQSILTILVMAFCWQANALVVRCDGMDLLLSPGSHNFGTNNFPTLTLTVSRTSTINGCDFFVAIDYGGAAGALDRRLVNSSYTYPVQLYKDSGRSQIIKRASDATSSSDVLSGNFPAGSGATSQDISYYAFLDPGLYNRFGNYSESFTVSLYSGTPAENQLELSRTLTLSYIQSKKIDVSLVDSGTAFNSQDTSQTLNFGTLVTGANQGLDVIVEYNAGVRMTVSSTNRGNIKHSSMMDLIPYTMTVNGSTLNLSAGSADLPSQTGISPTGGQRNPVQVTIGNTQDKVAGSYSDTVTFSVLSTE